MWIYLPTETDLVHRAYLRKRKIASKGEIEINEMKEEGEDRCLRITKVVSQGLNFIWSEVVFIPQDMIMCWSASTLSMQKQNTRDFTD